MNNSIYILKNYGKVQINLKEIIDTKNISRSKLSTMTALGYDIINRYYNNKVNRIDLDVISRFCYVLECNIGDLLKYKKN